ncbi:MAG TPA: Ig-like domain-containing protein [Allosphingosinicella sp.]|jgi:hypothetical protein
MTTTVSAKRTTTLFKDADSDGVADFGDIVLTTLLIKNEGSEDATNVTISDPNSGLTITNISPLARGDFFTAVGNTVLRVGSAGNIGDGPSSQVAGNLLANDVDVGPNAGVFAITTVTNGTSAGGGKYNIFSDGSFNYVNEAGDTGTDYFEYTITDRGADGIAGNADDLSSTGRVTITLTGEVWYVDGSKATNGTGTSDNPFNSITALNSANKDGVNDTIYVKGTAAGNLVLEAGQQLVGTNAALTVGGFSLAADTGANSTITSGSGFTLTLGTNNGMSGITIASTSALGGNGAVNGGGFGTLTVNDAAITSTTQGLILNTGTVAGTGFTGVTSSGGANNVNIASVSGTVNLGGGSLSGSTSSAFVVQGGNGSVDYNGTIGKTADGFVIQVANKTGGTVQFDGAVTGSNLNDGVSLTNNSSTTLNFNAGVNVSTAASGTAAFEATGTGTINIAAASGNTLSAGTGTAFKIDGVTIGSGGVTFQKVDSTGGSATGIFLNNAGSGGFTITGTGTAASGGTLANKTGADGQNATGVGIYINNTNNISLSDMAIDGNQNYGIRGSTVQNFSLNRSTLGTTAANGTSNTVDQDSTSLFAGEGSIRFTNLTGTATISNSTLNNGLSRTVAIDNHAGTLNLTVSNSTINQSQTSALTTDALYLATRGTAKADLTIVDSQFQSYRQFAVQTVANGTSTMNIDISNSNFSNSNAANVNASAALSLGGSGTDSFVSLNIHHNTFRHGAAGSASAPSNGGAQIVAGLVSGAGKFDGIIANNTFGVSGVTHSGSGAAADVLRIFSSGNAGTTRETGTTHSRFLIQNNIIQNYGEAGIQINARQGNSILDATVLGNTIRQPGTAALGAFAAIWVNSGALAADTNVVNVAIGGTAAADKNTLTNSDPSNATDIFLDSRTNAGAASFINLYRNGTAVTGSSTEDTARQILIADNNGPLDLLNGFTNASPIGFVNGLPPQPTLHVSAAAPAQSAAGPGEPGADADVDGQGPNGDGASDAAAVTVVDDGVISEAELSLIVEAAIQRWADAGATPGQLAAMRAVSVTVGSLSGLYLGAADSGRIVVDDNAAGYSWFIDSTPGEDSEFAGSPLTGLAGTAASTRVDLLTVVMHELGHQIGLGDSYAAGDADSLMFGTINAGERRLPGSGDAAAGGTGAVASTAYALAPVDIGTLKPGQSYTLSWTSTVDSLSNTVIPTYTSSATVSGGNFTTVTSTSNTLTVDSLSLGDIIFNDRNRNGGYDAGDVGIAGVALSLFADSNGNGVLDGAEATNVIAIATSTAGGFYAFNNLAPGDYVVRIDASNFATGGLLAGKLNTAPNATDPDDNVDSDNNGTVSGGAVLTAPVRLDYNQEGPAYNGATGNDSNTRLDIGVWAPNVAPTSANLAGNVARFLENATSIPLDNSANSTFADADSSNFAGGSLTVAIGAGLAAAQDGLIISQVGGVTSTATTVSVNGAQIGTYTGLGTATLTFSLGINATPATVQALARAISFTNNGGDAAVAGARTVNWTLVDGDGVAGMGSDTLAFASTVEVVLVNDHPEGGQANGATISDSATYTFKLADFAGGMTDPNDNPGHDFASVVIVTLPASSAGTIYFDSDGNPATAAVPISAGNEFTAQDLIDGTLTFVPAAGTGGTTPTFTFKVRDNGGTANGGVDLDPNADTFTFTVTQPNQAPTLDLDGATTPAVNNGVAYAEDAPGVALAPALEIADTDDADLTGATVSIGTGFLSSDALTIVGNASGTSGTISYSYNAGTGVMTFTGTASVADYQTLLRTVSFSSGSQAPGASRTVNWSVTDGTAASAPAATTVTITEANDAPVIVIGGNVTTTEDTPFVWSQSLGNRWSVSDADGDQLSVTLKVEHGTIALATTSGLASHSGNNTATVQLSGTAAAVNAAVATLTYTPTADYAGGDTLTFTVKDNGQSGTGGEQIDEDIATITVTASDDPTTVNPDTGTVSENTTTVIDVLFNDTDVDGPSPKVTHIAGQAVVPGGSVTLTSGAKVTLNMDGTLTYDPLAAFDDALTGAGSGGTNLSDTDLFSYTVSDGGTGQVTVTVDGVVSVGEKIIGSSGGNHFFVDDSEDEVIEGANGGEDTVETSVGVRTPQFNQSYTLPANVENLIGTNAAGQLIYDNGLDNMITLAGGNDLVALTAGGTDVVFANGGDDFIFSGGTWSAGDEVHGGEGFDTIGFFEPSTITFGANSLSGVELLQFYGDTSVGGPLRSYTVTLHNGNVAQGKTLLVTAGTLVAGETFTFDGSKELDGHFSVLSGGGNDTITGGSGGDYLDGRAGNDTLIGGIGKDTLTGGLGADILTGGADRDWFRYTSVNESNAASGIDTITDFLVGASDEKIDLKQIDANSIAGGDQAFNFIGTNVAFGKVAGELRVVEESGNWFVQGDIDGDGLADLIIQIGNGADIPLWGTNHFIL